MAEVDGNQKPHVFPHEEELERARIRLETAERNQCADGPDCGVCQGASKAAREEYQALRDLD